MRFNWFGIKAKEKTGKTGAAWVTTYPPLTLKEILSSPYIMRFDFDEEE
tara:strand:+ start:53 stop:199 length:147 start_codon:yes stop_codon:yes gene_type:complete